MASHLNLQTLRLEIMCLCFIIDFNMCFIKCFAILSFSVQCKLSPKIFNSMWLEIWGDPLNLTKGGKSCVQTSFQSISQSISARWYNGDIQNTWHTLLSCSWTNPRFIVALTSGTTEKWIVCRRSKYFHPTSLYSNRWTLYEKRRKHPTD